MMLFTIYAGIYVTAFVFTLVFPFASEMVMVFEVTNDKNKTGY